MQYTNRELVPISSNQRHEIVFVSISLEDMSGIQTPIENMEHTCSEQSSWHSRHHVLPVNPNFRYRPQPQVSFLSITTCGAWSIVIRHLLGGQEPEGSQPAGTARVFASTWQSTHTPPCPRQRYGCLPYLQTSSGLQPWQSRGTSLLQSIDMVPLKRQPHVQLPAPGQGVTRQPISFRVLSQIQFHGIDVTAKASPSV